MFVVNNEMGEFEMKVMVGMDFGENMLMELIVSGIINILFVFGK